MEPITLKQIACPKCQGAKPKKGEPKCTECDGKGHIAVNYSGKLIQK
jgi:DnaJ-class molecular chaperone